MSKTAQHTADIVAALRKKNVIVQCHVGRYVGVEGIDYALGKKEPIKVFARAKDGKLQTPREAQEFIKDPAIRALGLVPDFDSYGGITQVYLIDSESGAIMGDGAAKCHNDDKFNRSHGFKKALRRALNSAKLDNVKFK